VIGVPEDEVKFSKHIIPRGDSNNPADARAAFASLPDEVVVHLGGSAEECRTILTPTSLKIALAQKPKTLFVESLP
jgi:hypothetical protein